MGNKIIIKSLGDAELKAVKDWGSTVTARAKYNNHVLRITYYKELPKYEGWEPIQVTSRILIDGWYHLDNLEAVQAELLNIFDVLHVAAMLA